MSDQPSPMLNRLVAVERLLRGSGPDDPGLHARIGRLEEDMQVVKAVLSRVEPMIVRIDAQIPYLATKAELAAKPSHAYLWGVLAALLAAYGSGLAALAILK
ncbi:MAG: hypothetical protein HIU82_13635 [Proteobacteria bacterium]|nr:hypothetical protein [Pseudomonadota bacterium]